MDLARRCFLLPVLALVAALLPAAAAAAEPVTRCNVPIPVSDGATLRGNLFLPAATGRFPTAITVTGYNKDVDNPLGTSCSAQGGIAGGDPALVEAGYAVLVVDDRGTGASEGTWDSWGRRTQEDYVDLLDWLQAQPWSDGRAATTGSSYMGITSLLVAQADAARVAAGRPRAVRAVWANVPMADAYRDVTFHGGATDAGFIPLWLGLVNALSGLPPSTTPTDPGSAAPAWLQRLPGNGSFAASNVADAALGGDSAFDGPFYRLRSPGERAHELEIPVAWTGGWFDIFQRGEPLLYELLERAPSKKFWMTPTYHASGEEVFAQQGIGSVSDVRVRWFDRWVKGERNGVEDLPPVNLFTMGADRWQHLPDWPVPDTEYTRFHLGRGALATDRPAKPGGDSAPLLPASSPCSRLTAQWTAGAGAAGPCETDNRTFEASALTYTTEPLEQDTEVTGLISANLWATLSRPDANLVAVLSDVAPSGESTQLTAGFLQASHRAVDAGRSTRGPGGTVIRPFHPFTREAAEPVEPNEPQLYRIEIYPTSNVFKAGHRIRLTLSTANTPTTAPSLPAVGEQAGGTIRVLRGGRYDSHVLLPLRGAAAASARSVAQLPPRSCRSRRDFVIRLKRRRGTRIERVSVFVNGRRTRVLRGRRLRARVRLSGLPRGTFRVRVVVRARRGGRRVTLRDTRTYRTCRAGRRT
jgi:putative CocE/NonD family hydrolase